MTSIHALKVNINNLVHSVIDSENSFTTQESTIYRLLQKTLLAIIPTVKLIFSAISMMFNVSFLPFTIRMDINRAKNS